MCCCRSRPPASILGRICVPRLRKPHNPANSKPLEDSSSEEVQPSIFTRLVANKNSFSQSLTRRVQLSNLLETPLQLVPKLQIKGKGGGRKYLSMPSSAITFPQPWLNSKWVAIEVRIYSCDRSSDVM